jgi:hypothetical protein
MRVTDELVERLGYALDACEFKTPYADVPSMLRRILEDVLLHVPEPEPGPHTRTLNAMAEMIADREVRITELEAKLAKVRTWREEWGPAGYDELEAILDGTEGTCA